MASKFHTITLENAYIVTPWTSLVTRETPYKNLGNPKYTAKLMISNKSKGYQDILKYQERYHDLGTLPKNRSFFSSLKGSPGHNDYLDEERRIWTESKQDVNNWSIVKVTRTNGEHDLYSPKNKQIQKTPENSKYFTRGVKVNFIGGLSVFSDFPLLIIHSVQYVDKGFSDKLETSEYNKSSPFQSLESSEDPFEASEMDMPSFQEEYILESMDDDRPPF